MIPLNAIDISSASQLILAHQPRAEAVDLVNKLLQENHETKHISWHPASFHNHVVHHMLAIYAMGASTNQIQTHYDREVANLLPAHDRDESVIEELYDPDAFVAYLGQLHLYHTFLTFFEREIAAKGPIEAMNEYLFAGDKRAETMMIHLFTGLWHPWIHLGYALEFQQPLLMAEALAQIATHPTWNFEKVLVPAEKIAGQHGSKSMSEIIQRMGKDEKLISAPKWSNLNRFFDIFEGAEENMTKYASQFTVSEETLDDKVVELLESAGLSTPEPSVTVANEVSFSLAYFTACAQKPGKVPKLDFFLLHNVTSSIFLSNIIYHPSIDTRTRIRLVEFKGRADLITWASCRCPQVYPDLLRSHNKNKDWHELIRWALNHPEEDSHFTKTLRALMHAQKLCQERRRQGKEPSLMVEDDMWLKVGNMLVSTAESQPTWIFGAGFVEEWRSMLDDCYRQ